MQRLPRPERVLTSAWWPVARQVCFQPIPKGLPFGAVVHPSGPGGRSSMAELLLPKQIAWVRFPSPAPRQRRLIWTQAIAMSPPPTGRTGMEFHGRPCIRRSVGCRQGSRKLQRQVSGARCATCNDSSPDPRARKRAKPLRATPYAPCRDEGLTPPLGTSTPPRSATQGSRRHSRRLP